MKLIDVEARDLRVGDVVHLLGDDEFSIVIEIVPFRDKLMIALNNREWPWVAAKDQSAKMVPRKLRSLL